MIIKDNYNDFLEECVDLFFEKNKLQRKQPLQKYFNKKWFIQNLKNNTSTFVEPKNWDDPFEDFISKLRNQNSLVQTLNITSGTYAQSWISKKTECDGMWKNFASITDGVLIHTTIENVIRSLFKYLIEVPLCNTTRYDIKAILIGSVHMKKITYESNQYIADLFKTKTNSLLDDYKEVGLRLLSVKRKEFEYENEYRLFIEQPLLKLQNNKYLEVGYFKDLIDTIVIAPKMSQKNFYKLRDMLNTHCGFSYSNILKSQLYDIEHFRLEFNL